MYDGTSRLGLVLSGATTSVGAVACPAMAARPPSPPVFDPSEWNLEDDEEFPGRLLHQAALWENRELLEDLLNGEQAAFVDSMDQWGRTALHAAVANESNGCTCVLLQAGADISISCSSKHDNRTPLHVAAKHGRVENIKALVEWKADLLAKDRNGLTALDIAEQGGHEDCMNVLKQAADEREHFRYEIHKSLLDACSRVDMAKIRSLLKELNGELGMVINAAPNGSNTLLFKASEEGQKEVIKLLLENGADGRIHPVTKYSPLYIACYNGRKDIAEILLKRFPQLVQMPTVEHWLPIHAAAINGHVAIIDILLRFPYPAGVMQTFHDKSGAWEFQLPFDINARDVTGQTVLYLACYVGNQKLVESLLKFKVKAVKVDSKDERRPTADGGGDHFEERRSATPGMTPPPEKRDSGDTSPKRRLSGGIQMIISRLNLTKIGDATLRSNECMISPLNLDIYCSNDTETALHVAAKNQHHGIASLLLTNGADPNLRIRISEDDMSHAQEDDCTFTGSTALVEACRNRDYGMIELLLRHGARDDECKALVVAIRAQDEVTISKLLALKTHPDPEYKINKKALDVIPVSQFGALAFAGVGSVTYGSMFPTIPVMVNWHGQKCLDHLREQWLVDASTSHNQKLKLNVRNQLITLFAITRLDISNNSITELPESIFRLASLKYLNVAQNKIERLPRGRGKLIYQISPQHNKNKGGPAATAELSQYDCPVLEEVHLQDNRLDAVPSVLFGLPALVTLDLSNNKLQSLPFKMWTAPKLRELNVSFNLLNDLPLRPRTAAGDSGATRDVVNADEIGSVDGESSPRHGGGGTPREATPIAVESGVEVGENGVLEIFPDGVKYCVGEEAAETRDPRCRRDTRDDLAMLCPNMCSRELVHHNVWSHNVEINDSVLSEADDSRDSQSQLITLNLAHNAFEQVPPGLPCLAVNLARLNLGYNRLSDMGVVSAYPVGLKQLDLSHNQIRTWPTTRRSAESDVHAEAQGLYCYGSSESSPRHSGKGGPLVPLRKLAQNARGSSSSLTSLGQSFCGHRRHYRLDNLRTLILADNEFDRLIVCIDDDVVGVTSDDDDSQESSDANGSSGRDATKCATAGGIKTKLLFPNVSMLDMSNNKLREIPINIYELNNLSVLNVSGNHEITHLPPEMGLLNKLWNLNTRNCNLSEPLKTMIDSKKYKTMDVIGYLKSILEDAKPYARMKLMIVGVQGIGKTSLLNQLRQEGTGSYKKKPVEHWAKRMGNKNINLKTAKGVNLSTVGVDICDWTYEKKIRGHSPHGPVTFRTWDFGGQREYYATHQYFLSKRSLYLVTWKIPDGERGVSGIQQWLVNIQARAPNSPVLIIGTHYDLVKEKYPPSFSEDLQQLIRDRFINVIDADKCGLPRVLDTIEISCKSRHNVKLLCNLIYDTVFELRSSGSKERLLEQRIPATYLALEDVVGYLAVERQIQNKDPVLQSEQYKLLVMHEMQERFHLVFRDMAELNQATAFLHENGVLLHYEDATLKDLYFLDPQWLCDMLAHVVTIREINPFAKNGVMKMDDLKHTFKSSQCAPTDAKHYIVNLLNKFEVALTWDNRTLLIPSLLPSEEQLRSGLPGCDVRIPVRSRGWAFRSKNYANASKGVAFGGGGSPKKSDDGADIAGGGSPVFGGVAAPGDCLVQHHFDPHASIRRLLIMSYFPSGFWSRLLTRMLADDGIVEIVRSYFMLPPDAQHDPAVLRVLDKKAEWVCWQTGIELRYANTSLFRMKEVLPNLSNSPCEYRRMRFVLQQEGVWAELDISGSAILEVLLTNQTIVLKRPFPAEEDVEDVLPYQSVVLEPNPECVAKLLALAVDHIDTLLEDWYPTLGTRFVHTSEGKFLVTRVVPCTPCLVSQFVNDLSSNGGHYPGNGGGCDKDAWNIVDTGSRSGEACVSQEVNLLSGAGCHLPPDHGRAGNLSPGGGGGRHRNRGSRDSTTSHDSDSGVGPDSASSSRKPSVEGRFDLEPAGNGQSVDDNDGEASTHRSVYCFMIEECILTAYEEKCMRCVVHGGIPLAQIAPDTVFMDLGERYLIRPESIKRGKMLGRGAFGFVFRASAKQRASNMNIDVAMKMLQPVDPGYGARQSASAAFKAAQSKWQRDPIQYACKAYCTARQELGILLSLRHTYIVPLVGMCTHPLSLVLELAPQGALDTMLKNYRRSGAKLHVLVLQKVIIMIAKALEYLHSQHIIYRDLKSENVLVWQLPPPFHKDPTEAVDVKLADYGISRATLPTGTKGFGGTEGFMAPEIMRYNGEEEYTEKVDCFSFGMFLYELLTLHLPFEGHESVKDHILEGGRPSLTQREILYPTYILDLMTLCWSQHPKDRPSASQIVSIAAAPEFCHLMDVTWLEGSMPVICGVVVSPREDAGAPSLIEQTELWLSRKGKQIDILSCTYNGWQDYKSMEPDSMTISRICLVEDTLWLGDSKGSIHIFSVSRYVRLMTFALEPDATVPSAINSLFYIKGNKLVVVTLVNGRLWLCKTEDLLSQHTLASDEMVFNSLIELGSNGLIIHCTAAISSSNQKPCELWCGQAMGQMTVFTLHGTIVAAQDVFNHSETISDTLDVLYVTTDESDQDSIWSYVYPGCIVYHWDVPGRTILNKLDCSKLAPCSESLKSISIEEHLSPGRCQVTTMAALNGELFIGTTWGCIIVAEGETMRPITIFRPFEEEVKLILPLMGSTKEVIIPEVKSPRGSPVRSPSHQASPSPPVTPQPVSHPPMVATIGKGYRNLIGRFTSIPLTPAITSTNPSVAVKPNPKKSMVALLWKADNWAGN